VSPIKSRKTLEPAPTRLSEEDQELLAQAYRQVIALKGHRRVVHQRPCVHAGLSEQTRHRRANALEDVRYEHTLSDGDPEYAQNTLENYRVSGVAEETLRRLRREARQITETLDLHGLNREQARAIVTHFIENARARGIYRVCIIHGQGFGSNLGTSVLRYLTRHWLSQMPAVLAFTSPPQTNGGKGAVLVLLRSTQSIHHGS
jgi:DNA-nicking Smr family endonuclease